MDLKCSKVVVQFDNYDAENIKSNKNTIQSISSTGSAKKVSEHVTKPTEVIEAEHTSIVTSSAGSDGGCNVLDSTSAKQDTPYIHSNIKTSSSINSIASSPAKYEFGNLVSGLIEMPALQFQNHHLPHSTMSRPFILPQLNMSNIPIQPLVHPFPSTFPPVINCNSSSWSFPMYTSVPLNPFLHPFSPYRFAGNNMADQSSMFRPPFSFGQLQIPPSNVGNKHVHEKNMSANSIDESSEKLRSYNEESVRIQNSVKCVTDSAIAESSELPSTDESRDIVVSDDQEENVNVDASTSNCVPVVEKSPSKCRTDGSSWQPLPCFNESIVTCEYNNHIYSRL